MKKWMGLCLTALLLGACSEESAEEPAQTAPDTEIEAPAQQQELTEEGFITQVTADGIMVNNIFFGVDENAAVAWEKEEGKSEAVLRDIQAGQKVAVDYEGAPTGQFPMEAEAQSITILNNEEAERQSAALQAFIQEEQFTRLVILGQPIVRGDEIGFLFTNMENGKISEVRINLDTHEYSSGSSEAEEAS